MKTPLPLIAALLCAAPVSAALTTPDTATAPDTAAVAHAPAVQSDDASYEMQFLPSVIPPTPQAAALARYGEYPVSHTTGIPDITIPLYEIDLGGYKLPITISYHASGFRPDDVATPVGLGWVLNAGGAVTRTIMGAPDFHETVINDTLYRNFNTLNTHMEHLSHNGGNIREMLLTAAGGMEAPYDTESDRYTYTMPGESGIFRYSHESHEWIPLTATPIRVNRNGDGFVINDTNGVIYTFSEEERTGFCPSGEGTPVTTSWYLSRIRTPHGDIRFTYMLKPPYVVSRVSQSVHVTEVIVPANEDRTVKYKVYPTRSEPAQYYYDQLLLTEISWDGGCISLHYKNDGKDIGTHTLSKISVRSDTGASKKDILFTASYSGTSRYDRRRMLDSVYDSENGTYAFSYEPFKHFPDYRYVSQGTMDYWGYLRTPCGKSFPVTERALEMILPDDMFEPEKYLDLCSSNDPSFEHTLSGTLKSITGPTGATSTFEYEPNTYGGGLRIAGVTISGGNAIRNIRYDYDFAESTLPDADECMAYRSYINYQGIAIGPGVIVERNVATASPTFSPYGGPGVFYSSVTVTEGEGCSVHYSYDIGSTHGYYAITDNDPLKHPLLYFGALNDEGGITPLLVSKITYDKDGGKTLSETYEYETVRHRVFATGVRLVSLLTECDGNTGMDTTGSNFCCRSTYMPREKTSAIARAFNRVRKTVTDHVTGVVTEHTYTYDPQLRTLKPRSVAFTDSDGARDSTRYGFPFDRTDPASLFMTEYMPDAVLSVERFRDGARASRTETSYVLDDDVMWAFRESISTAFGDGALQERERVLSRGAGNRPTAILVNTVDTTLIEWDAKGLYPMKITAPGGLSTRYEWKPLTGVTMVTDPRDYKTAYGYDTAGRLSFIRDARDTLQTFSYSIVNGPYGTQTDNSVTTMRHLNASGTRVMTRQYHDHLGRPTVLAQGGLNTAGTYVYTLQTYDTSGRVADSWLPVEGTPSIKNPTSSEIAAWAQSTYSDSHASSTATYDGADRPVRSTTPGDLWHAAGKGRDIVRLTNAANSVRRYSAPVDGTSLVKAGYYPAGSLHGEKTVDEDGNSITVFTDKAGRRVLERRGSSNDTYFVYNAWGQLRFVLSPEYQTAGYKEKYAYEYRYDTRGNVVKRFIPGCGYTQYWYDRADRLTFMQDPTLREAGLYRFYLYDRAGRLAVQGTAAACSRSAAVNPVTYTHGSPGIGSTGYVMADPSRISAPVVESATYYDTYTLPAAFTPLKLASAPQVNTTGLATASLGVASDGTPLRSVTYYDGFGRVTERRSTGLRGALAIENTFYSYTDQPVKTRFREGAVSVTTDYTYDHATDLLLSRRVTADTGSGAYSALVASYSYDPLGNVSGVTLGNSAGTVTYTRDLHGRLRTVSHPAFSQRLFYADGPGTPLYSGRISSMMWKSTDWYRWRGYRYTYNALGWLTKAQYGENETLTTDRDHYTLSIDEFTANGSIRRLQRHGMKDNGKYGKIDNLRLHYDGNRLVSVEEDAGRVTREGANDFTGGGNTYTYNSAGALTSDLNRRIRKITYDNLNRPVKIDMSTLSAVENVYSADGARLRTVHNTFLGLTSVPRPDDGDDDGFDAGFVTPGGSQGGSPLVTEALYRRDTLDYSGPVIYENGAVKRVMFEGGYATFDAKGVPGWHYFLCDHAGSVRVVADMWGRAEQINHYYPYGLTFADAGKAPDHQPFKFGGKELDAMYGLNLHDFHARLQIPDLGRFDRPDPLCEKTPHLSPYLFCANDPVNNTDPTGKIVEYLGADPEREDVIKTCIQTLRNNSKVFNEVYECLESLSDVITVGLGITSDTGNGEKAPGEYRVDEKAIVFNMSNENPSYSVISEEFYHAYQEANKSFNIGEWNREFEAKVATSVICGEAGTGFPPYLNMESFSNEVNLNKPSGSSGDFASKYIFHGNKFANSYKNLPNYNVPVNSIPNTLKYLLRK